jgi:o-succinylbenzoate synthase
VAGAADIAVLKVAPLGGVRRALAVAEACGLPCVVSSAVETSVGLAAGLALAAALPSLDYACGLGTLSLLAKDVAGAAGKPVDGWLPAPRKAPEPDLYEETDDNTRQRWLDRLARVRSVGGAGLR